MNAGYRELTARRPGLYGPQQDCGSPGKLLNTGWEAA
jgi:hypothetical protein